MVFLDVNTFLSPRGGGSRTYHLRKASWFSRQAGHAYITLQPDVRRGILPSRSPNIEHHTARGLLIGDNYRFLWDLEVGNDLLRRRHVDVLEAGDPWATALWTAQRRDVLRTAFWHSDPHTAYFDPVARRCGPVAGAALHLAGKTVDAVHRRFDRIWCASRWVAGKLRARGLENVAVLPFGIDHAHFTPRPRKAELIASLGLSPDRPVLLYAGRLDPEKSVDVLMEAIDPLLALPQRPQIVVTGRGKHDAWFGELRREGYLYLGYLDDRDRLADLYASADLYLATCAVETFGLGVLEALTMGLPVVSADDGGGAEQVSDSGGGTLFRAGSAADLARAVEEALPRRAELSARATAWGRAWPSWDDMFRRQAEGNLELLARRAGSRS